MDDATHIIVALIGLFGISVGGVFSYLTHRHAREINDAVNHRHDKAGPEAPKLYDLAWENHKKADELIQWKRQYDGGPLSTGSQVVEFCSETSKKLNNIECRVNHLHEKCHSQDDCGHPKPDKDKTDGVGTED